jgi:hypothetical protein
VPREPLTKPFSVHRLAVSITRHPKGIIDLSQKVFGFILIGRFGSQPLVNSFEPLHWQAAISEPVVVVEVYFGVGAVET